MVAEVANSLEARMRRADDRAARIRFASELGHALALGHLNAEEAGKVARQASRMRSADAEALAYWGAVRDVTGAAAAALEDGEERGALEHDIETLPGWKATLLALRERARTPTELAPLFDPRLEHDDGRVSKQLKRMADRGLVQTAAAGEDGRTRPRQLTPRGHRLAVELARRGAASQSLGSRPGSELDIATAVVSMIGLLQAPRGGLPLRVGELAACAGPRDAGTERLALHVARLCESIGLVDLDVDQSIRWGRKGASAWGNVLSKCGRKDLEEAFSTVPGGFLMCTDKTTMDDWRDALGAAEIAVSDVCPPRLAQVLMGEPWPAIVIDDPTYGPMLGGAAGVEHVLYIAEPSRKPTPLTVRRALA